MAIALVTSQKAQTQTTTPAPSFPVALPAGATAGNLLVLAVVYFGGTPAATFVTDNEGNTWAQAGIWRHNSSNGFVGIFYAANVIAATQTVTVHYSANFGGVTLCVAEFSGVATSSPLDNTNGGTGNSRTPNSGTITPATANELFLFLVTPDASTTIATVTSWTNLGKEQSTSTFGEMGFDFLIDTGTAALGVSQTNLLGTATDWACMIAAFKVASGGASLSFTGSGTIALSGIAAVNLGLNVSGSGSLVLSGAASGLRNLHYLGSGTLAISGAASGLRGLKYVGAGSMALSGIAANQVGLHVVGNGVLTLSGLATPTKALHTTGSGTMLVSGNAGASKALHTVGGGSLILSGIATFQKGSFFIGSGGMTLSGTATAHKNLAWLGTGSLTLAGSANRAFNLKATGGGTLALLGTAPFSNHFVVRVGLTYSAVDVFDVYERVDSSPTMSLQVSCYPTLELGSVEWQ